MTANRLPPPENPRPAKVSAPRAAGAVQRERLLRRLDIHHTTRATWVHAPPGSAKTTLAASLLEATGFAHLWYRLDHEDGDLATFLEQFGRQVETLGDSRAQHNQPLPLGAPLVGDALIQFSRTFFRACYARLPTPFIWVFDKTDELPDDSMTLAALAIACEEAPEGTRVILLSRNAPAPSMARLELTGLLETLGPDDLAFTAEETAALLADDAVPPDPAHIASIQQRTHGWATGIRLLRHDSSGSTRGVTSDAHDQRRRLAGYFSSEVLVQVPIDLRDELATLALVDSPTLGIITGLSSSPALLPLLRRLADDKLFVDRLSGPASAFRMHPMFRAFLLDWLIANLPDDKIRVLKRRTAELLIAHDRPGEAVVLFHELEEWASLRRMIEHHSPHMMFSGQFERLGDWLALLPAEQRDVDPMMRYWDGARRLYTAPADAKRYFTQAYDAFDARDDANGLALSWTGFVEAVFNEYAMLTQLDPWLDRFERRIEPLLEQLDTAVSGRVLVTRFMALVFRRPDDPALPALTSLVTRMAGEIGDPSVAGMIRCQLFLRALWTGNLAAARIEQAALRELANAPGASALTRLFTLLNDATLKLFQGDLPNCERDVSTALALSAQSGVRLWDAVLIGHRISALLARGKPDEAEACMPALRQSLCHDRHSEISRYYGFAAWFEAHRGAHDQAVRFLGRCEQEVDLGGIPMFQAIARLTHAETLSCIDPADPRIGLALSEAADIGRRIGNPMLQWMAGTALAGHLACCEDAGPEGEARAQEVASEAFATGARNDYRHFICWPAVLVGSACELALRHGIETGYTQRLIRHNGIAPSARAVALDDWPWPIRIRTLGAFSILVNGEPPPSGRKQRKVPLRLLQRLIAGGGRGVREQEISDDLWPESDGDEANANLAINLVRLREMLQVNCIERKGGRLTLDDRQVWIDVWALDRALGQHDASAGEEKDPRAGTEWRPEQIRALYRGPFLGQEEENTWSLAMRKRLQGALAGYIVKQVTISLRDKRYDDVDAWCECGLLVDDTVEEFYRGLMQNRLVAGDLIEVEKVYRRCEAVLRAKLHLQPGAKTREIHRQGMRQT